MNLNLLIIGSSFASPLHTFIIPIKAYITPKEYKIVLVGLIKKGEKIHSNILCIGRTNNTKELAEIYTAADIFVNPTYQDNYPTVNLEAQACGTPVITYRTGGSSESVIDCGIVEKGDVKALAEAINNFSKIKLTKLNDKNDRYSEYLDIYEGTQK